MFKVARRSANELGPAYFIKRAFFKTRLSDDYRRFTIPKHERETLNITEDTEVDILLIHPNRRVNPATIKNKNVGKSGEVYIRKSEFRQVGSLMENRSIRLRTELDEKEIMQVVVTRSNSGVDLDNVVNRVNKQFFFNNAIFKDVVKVGGMHYITVPKIEKEAIGIDYGDSLNIVLVTGDDIPLAKRSIFRGSLGRNNIVTIKKQRILFENLEMGHKVQVIARPTIL